jgi:hypothetical protein
MHVVLCVTRPQLGDSSLSSSAGLTRWVNWAGNIIWVMFLVEFLLRFGIAPAKLTFLQRNWLTLIALALPALRVLRITRALRLLRYTRGLKLARLLTSVNRGLRFATTCHAKARRWVCTRTHACSDVGRCRRHAGFRGQRPNIASADTPRLCGGLQWSLLSLARTETQYRQRGLIAVRREIAELRELLQQEARDARSPR